MWTHRDGLRWVSIGLCLGLFAVSAVKAQEAETDAAERKVTERFQTVLEKTPRRGTALDRVYGYHVEHARSTRS